MQFHHVTSLVKAAKVSAICSKVFGLKDIDKLSQLLYITDIQKKELIIIIRVFAALSIFSVSILVAACNQEKPTVVTYGPQMPKSECSLPVPTHSTNSFGYYCRCEIMGEGKCEWKLHKL